MLPARNLKMAGILLLFCAGLVYYHLALLRPASLSYWSSQGRGTGFAFGTDLYPLWLTSRALFRNHADPYSPEMTAEIQRGLFGREMDPGNPDDPPRDYRTFSYPLYADYFLLPFVGVSFEKLRLGAVVVLALITAGTVLFWLRALGLRFSAMQKLVAVVLVLTSYYALEALYAEQIGLLVACFLAAGIWCIREQKFAWAGLWLALATMKPQVSALLIAGILIWAISQWSERRSLIVSFIASIVGLYAASEGLHRGWLPEWLHVLWHYRDYGTPPLTHFLCGRSGGLFLSAALCGAVAIAWLRVRHEPAFSRRLRAVTAATLAVTAVALLSAQAVYDQLILLPAVLLLINSRVGVWQGPVRLRIVALLTVTALAWPWVLGSAVTAAALILSPARIRHSILALRLPLYSAYVFPFLLLALLWMARKEIEN